MSLLDPLLLATLGQVHHHEGHLVGAAQVLAAQVAALPVCILHIIIQEGEFYLVNTLVDFFLKSEGFRACRWILAGGFW